MSPVRQICNKYCILLFFINASRLHRFCYVIWLDGKAKMASDRRYLWSLLPSVSQNGVKTKKLRCSEWLRRIFGEPETANQSKKSIFIQCLGCRRRTWFIRRPLVFFFCGLGSCDNSCFLTPHIELNPRLTAIYSTRAFFDTQFPSFLHKNYRRGST